MRNVTAVTIYASLGEEALCYSLKEVFVTPLSLLFFTHLSVWNVLLICYISLNLIMLSTQ